MKIVKYKFFGHFKSVIMENGFLGKVCRKSASKIAPTCQEIELKIPRKFKYSPRVLVIIV
jgi:hypothetical protein